MKLKSFLLMALAASTTLAACDKSENPTPDQSSKSVTITLPNIDQSRAIGDAQDAVKASLKNLKIFFLSGNTPLADDAIPQFDNAAQPVYFDTYTEASIPATITFHFLPASVNNVVVVGNVENGNVDYATAIAAQSVLNDGDTGVAADANGHPYYPLYGKAELKLKDGADEKEHNNVYEAEVNLAPQIARFEIYGFEYLPAADGTFTYDALELDKIALSKYHTLYDPTNGDATDSEIACPTEAAKIWDWINAAATPWANDLTEFSLGHEKVFVTNNTKGAAIPADNTQGDNAEKIITYGLTKVEDIANNPELLLSFYGTKTGNSQKTPHYLRATFTNTAKAEAIMPGKIYRVLFSFTDGSWNAPDRCVEMKVTVSDWVIKVVTPEFN